MSSAPLQPYRMKAGAREGADSFRRDELQASTLGAPKPIPHLSRPQQEVLEGTPRAQI